MPWTSGHQFAAHTADASWKFWRRRARLPCPPRDDLGRPRGARSSCAPAASWESSCLSARHPFCCCITALRFATRLSRHVVREAPVKDDAAIGGCTEVHDTLPIARQRPAPGAPAKETAHRCTAFDTTLTSLTCICLSALNAFSPVNAKANGDSERANVNSSISMTTVACTATKDVLSTRRKAPRIHQSSTFLRGSAGTHVRTATPCMKSSQSTTP
mmetsp:Transcript_35196/g.84085  ORF Transcript_35196/g.84085 Transcript_35196/m.84085 type:complete len:216 (+) Transcript_35196:576-1223(+)